MLRLNHMKKHSPRFLEFVSKTKQAIHEISPQTLKKMQDEKTPFVLIDVREESEFKTGFIEGAIHLSKGVIERDIEKIIPDIHARIVVYCSGGFRCALVAYNLQAMGYCHVSSLATGSQGWIDAGYALCDA